jgi:hypothetical protein
MAIYVTTKQPKEISLPDTEARDQFVRLASAMLKSRYKFKPQRVAIAAKMYIQWLERKKH